MTFATSLAANQVELLKSWEDTGAVLVEALFGPTVPVDFPPEATEADDSQGSLPIDFAVVGRNDGPIEPSGTRTPPTIFPITKRLVRLGTSCNSTTGSAAFPRTARNT